MQDFIASLHPDFCLLNKKSVDAEQLVTYEMMVSRFFPLFLEMFFSGELKIFASRNLIQSCKISKIDITHLLLPVGDGGDESHPSHPGLHVLL